MFLDFFLLNPITHGGGGHKDPGRIQRAIWPRTKGSKLTVHTLWLFLNVSWDRIKPIKRYGKISPNYTNPAAISQTWVLYIIIDFNRRIAWTHLTWAFLEYIWHNLSQYPAMLNLNGEEWRGG